VAVDLFFFLKKPVVSLGLGCQSVVVCSSLWWLLALIWGLLACYSVGVMNFWWVSCLNLKVAWCGEKCSLEEIVKVNSSQQTGGLTAAIHRKQLSMFSVKSYLNV
jgi:hypothetical protein